MNFDSHHFYFKNFRPLNEDKKIKIKTLNFSILYLDPLNYPPQFLDPLKKWSRQELGRKNDRPFIVKLWRLILQAWKLRIKCQDFYTQDQPTICEISWAIVLNAYLKLDWDVLFFSTNRLLDRKTIFPQFSSADPEAWSLGVKSKKTEQNLIWLVVKVFISDPEGLQTLLIYGF